MGEPYGPHYGLGDRVSDYVLYDPWLEYSWPAPPPTIKVEPPSYTAKLLNQTFSINITINNLSVGWRAVAVQFMLTYNATLLEIVNVTEGPFMKQAGDTFFVYAVDYHPLHGNHILVGVLILPNQTGQYNAFPSGNGTIATITFKVIYQEKGYSKTLGFFKPSLACNLTLTPLTKILDDQRNLVFCYLEHGYYEVPHTNIADMNLDELWMFLTC